MMDTHDANKGAELGYTLIEDLLQLMPDISPDTIVSRTIFGAGGMKGILFGFAAGQELSEHTASRPAVLHFLAGEARLTLGEDELEARPGTWAHMPAHLPHSIMAHTEVVMLLLLLP